MTRPLSCRNHCSCPDLNRWGLPVSGLYALPTLVTTFLKSRVLSSCKGPKMVQSVVSKRAAEKATRDFTAGVRRFSSEKLKVCSHTKPQKHWQTWLMYLCLHSPSPVYPLCLAAPPDPEPRPDHRPAAAPETSRTSSLRENCTKSRTGNTALKLWQSFIHVWVWSLDWVQVLSQQVGQRLVCWTVLTDSIWSMSPNVGLTADWFFSIMWYDWFTKVNMLHQWKASRFYVRTCATKSDLVSSFLL